MVSVTSDENAPPQENEVLEDVDLEAKAEATELADTYAQFAVPGDPEAPDEDDDDSWKNVVPEVMTKDTSECSKIKEMKESESYTLQETIYAFLFVAEIKSAPFWFAMSIVILKDIIYLILLYDIKFSNDFDSSNYGAMIAKGLLTPVAVAMQEDLTSTFWFYANAVYCPHARMKGNPGATKAKLNFSYILRLIDGVLSLAVNYGVLLTTDNTLGVFLNFAALGFLQEIDDAFYKLVQEGFFGDSMQSMTTKCANVDLNRRCGDENKRILFLFRSSHLDTILFFATLLICYTAYIVTTLAIYDVFPNNLLSR